MGRYTQQHNRLMVHTPNSHGTVQTTAKSTHGTHTEQSWHGANNARIGSWYTQRTVMVRINFLHLGVKIRCAAASGRGRTLQLVIHTVVPVLLAS